MPDLVKRQRIKKVLDSSKEIKAEPLTETKPKSSKVVKPSQSDRYGSTDTGTGSKVTSASSATQGVKNGIVSATGQSGQGGQRMSGSKKKASSKPKMSKQEKMATQAQKLAKQKQKEQRQKRQSQSRERIERAMRKGG